MKEKGIKEEFRPIHPILIVDDEEAAIDGCRWMLESAGLYNSVGCREILKVHAMLELGSFSLVILDLSMPDGSGEELLSRLNLEYPQIPVVILTGNEELDTAVRCMKAGAFDYLSKPIDEAKLISTVRRALEIGELRSECASLKDHVLTNKLEHLDAFKHIVTRNSGMYSMFQYAETIALTPRPILITGETGVGKELVARAVHNISKPGRPFVALNVAGLDDNMFSDTLFGHVKGAFTGADKPRQGLIERASGGTLFLDEIGDMEPVSQIKLLRVLQENEYIQLGSDVTCRTDARIIVATNRDLNAFQQEGRFRRDLYYRLLTHSINIPPLRKRLDDVPLLVEHFAIQAAGILRKPKPVIRGEITDILGAYDFPGNVRELEGMVFDAVSRHKSGALSIAVFRTHISVHGEAVTAGPAVSAASTGSHGKPDQPSRPFANFAVLPKLPEIPIMAIEEALRRSNGNQTEAAKLLGITRSGLSKAIKRYGIKQ